MDSNSSSEFEEDTCDLPVISDLNISNDIYYSKLKDRQKLQEFLNLSKQLDESRIVIRINPHDCYVSDKISKPATNYNQTLTNNFVHNKQLTTTKSNQEYGQEDYDYDSDDHHQITSLPLNRIAHIDNFLAHIPKCGKRGIQHTLPAYDLWRPFYPTHLSSEKLLSFHRPKLRHFNTGPQARFKRATSKPMPIKNLARVISLKEAELQFRVQQDILIGKDRKEVINKYLRIYNAKQLTAKLGQLHLFEYSEENPPILSQVGMSSILNTYTADPSKREQLYFNKTAEKFRMKVIENNMYRAPIFEHQMQNCDFLIIRTRNNFYIRPVNGLYTVGQTMPLVEVPSPCANNILRFRTLISNLYIHKLFKDTQPNKLPHIKLSTLVKLFPDYNDGASFKNRLYSNGTYFVKDRNIYTRGSSNYGLIGMKDQWAILTPEKYCLYMSMLAGREKLRDLNYTETMINPPKEAVIETEVLAAPWNTTSSWLNCLKGKHYLDFKSHLVDPTGSKQEGFSCIAWEKSPLSQEFETNELLNKDHLANLQNKRMILSRIRNEQETRKRIYLNEGKLIAAVQSKALASDEVLSTDEESDMEIDEPNASQNDSLFENHVSDLSRLVLDGRTSEELTHEKEEAIRRQMIQELGNKKDNPINQGIRNKEDFLKDKNDNERTSDTGGKVLIITRRYEIDGKFIERTELVREPRVIELYVKETKSPRVSPSINHEATQLNNSFGDSISMDRTMNMTINLRRRSSTINHFDLLKQNDLCRAEGTKLIISKKVIPNA